MEFRNAIECQSLLNEEGALALDIREAYEYEYCNCGFQHIPMADLPMRLKEFDRHRKVILMCKSGKRAEAAGNLLETEMGFSHIIVLENGILGWKEHIDPTLTIE